MYLPVINGHFMISFLAFQPIIGQFILLMYPKLDEAYLSKGERGIGAVLIVS